MYWIRNRLGYGQCGTALGAVDDLAHHPCESSKTGMAVAALKCTAHFRNKHLLVTFGTFDNLPHIVFINR